MEYCLVEKKELIKLLKNDLELSLLESDGVDNWSNYHEGYYEFIEEIIEDNKEYFLNYFDEDSLDGLDLDELAVFYADTGYETVEK